MSAFDHNKYRATPPIRLSDRQWPNQHITAAPQWCSVDLRDGNQALVNPMTIAQKHRLFDQLVSMGFEHIEVGFPAASQTDFDFIRQIIEQNKIPSHVSIQVLTPARDALIERTFEALKGANKAIVHIYNSTSTIQRERVFKQDQNGIKAIAIHGAEKVKQQAQQYPDTQWQFQYSPESFTQTEADYAVEVCNAVIDVWQDSLMPIIINLPATVEVQTPNVFADQVEYICRHIQHRHKVVISLHTHNDRGTAVAAAELGIMAGADRVEGTLLGNGERTGNMDIITMAMNLYSQGIDPQLNMADMDSIIETVKHCTEIELHPRHPYAGELVFTAFSGSHQDAINKCLQQQQHHEHWQVAYLPIDPKDIGRNYEAVIRINSQSGKGGIAYMIKQHLGIDMPRWMQIEFSRIVQAHTEVSGQEVNSDDIVQLFTTHYSASTQDVALHSYKTVRKGQQQIIEIDIEISAQRQQAEAIGSGAMDAFCRCLQQLLNVDIHIIEFVEHAVNGASELTSNSDASAHSFIQANINGQRYSGFADSPDITEAGMLALLCATQRYLKAHNNAIKALAEQSL